MQTIGQMNSMKPQFHDALSKIFVFAEAAAAAGLGPRSDTASDGDKEDLVEQLRALVAYMRSQDMEGFDFAAHFLPRPGELGPWTARSTCDDVLWNCCSRLWVGKFGMVLAESHAL